MTKNESIQRCLRAEAENAELRAELETERIRLAGCGVAAMCNTEKTIAERITADNPYYSASYQDVCSAVDREMNLRADLEKVKKIAIAHMDKLPARLNTARMAGRNEANQSWEEGWEFGRKCEQQMKDENATFTAEIMKYEAELEAVEKELTDYKNKYATMAGEVDCRTLDMVRWKERAEQADLALHIANTDKARAAKELGEVRCKYNELIMAVGNKYSNESRHETALRYIKRIEEPTDETAAEIMEEPK